MSSQVDVFNLALTKLGQDRAISVDDDAEAVRVLRSLWDITRDTVLARHPWRFALKRASLPADAAQPLYGWERQFELPEEALRLVQVGDADAWYTSELTVFQLEGAMVMTDEAAPLRVRYVRRVTNVGDWPPLFCRAVAMQLAADACEKLVQSLSKQSGAVAEYERAVTEARQQNAIERPPAPAQHSRWLESRGD